MLVREEAVGLVSGVLEKEMGEKPLDEEEALLARLSQVEGQAKVLEARVEALAREVREDSKAWTKDCKMAGEELMRLLTTVDGIQVKTAEVKSRKKELSTRLIKAMDMNENNVESRKKEEGRKEGGRRKEGRRKEEHSVLDSSVGNVNEDPEKVEAEVELMDKEEDAEEDRDDACQDNVRSKKPQKKVVSKKPHGKVSLEKEVAADILEKDLRKEPVDEGVEEEDINKDAENLFKRENSDNIKWSCKINNENLKQQINELLPKHAQTKVVLFEDIKQSKEGHKEENMFNIVLQVNICNENEVDEYIEALEHRSQTEFKKGDKRESKDKGWIRKTRHCCRKLKTYIQDHQQQPTDGGRGRGGGKQRGKPGAKLGQPKQAGKHTNCETKLSYTLKKCNTKECKGVHDDFKLSIRLFYKHNHSVISNRNFKFAQVSKETEEKILAIFKSGKPPSKAMRFYRSNLKKELGNIGYLKIAADRSRNPDQTYYFNLFASYCNTTFGSINGPDATKKAFEMIKEYNKEAQEELALMTFTDDNEVVIVILDEMTKRVHKLVKQAGDIVYVDGTGTLDRTDTQLFKLMTCSPAGDSAPALACDSIPAFSFYISCFLLLLMFLTDPV